MEGNFSRAYTCKFPTAERTLGLHAIPEDQGWDVVMRERGGRWNRLCQVSKVSLRSSDDLSEGQREKLVVQSLHRVQLFVTP